MITQARLKEVIHYDKDTGVFQWVEVTGNQCKLNTPLECSPSCDYLLITIDKVTYRAHRLAWLYVYGVMPNSIIDHIDGNTKNNAISNLRKADRVTNGYNSKLRCDSKTGVKGVTWDKTRNKYRVCLVVNKVQYQLGRFDDLEFASLVIREARDKYHGEFARHE